MFPYAPGQDVFGGSMGGGSFRYFATAGLNYPAACPGSDLGELVKHFMYDGVGRLVRVSSPVDPEMVGEGYSMPSNGVNTFTHSERFFYDGTRRVQELVTDPVVVNNEDGDVPLMGDESQQGNQTVPGAQYAVSYMRAQYVWGPGDGTNGVDELLCQLDPVDTSSSSYSSGGGKPWYVLTDAQGDVVSVVHVPPGTNTIAEVGGQWTYSPYGEVLTYEQFHPHPSVVFGHKTLAVDRLDGEALSWSATAGMSETKRLEPGARLLSYNRARTADPKHGRFLQKDPNGSGSTHADSLLYHGVAPNALSVTVDVQKRSGDGLNLFEYLGGNPLTRRDPLGLYLEPSEAVGLGIAVKRLASELVGEYSFNQELDADWASDWTQGDSDHTRMDAAWVDDILTSFIEENVGEYDDGPVMGAGLVTTLVKGGKLARAGRATWTAAQAALEMHHLISMFMGGMSSGAKVPIPMQTHRGEGNSLHNALGQLCKDTWGVHPNGPGGGRDIRRQMDAASLRKLQKFRSDYFRILDAYEPGAAAKARKELNAQRKVMKLAGKKRKGFLR